MRDQARIDQLATILWDYLQLHQTPRKSDLIFCLCSHDRRVAQRASELMLAGYGDYLAFSGGVGMLTTKNMFASSEAQAFAEIAIASGVDTSRILIEDRSTNTGENIRFTYELLVRNSIPHASILLVQKPYMERRTLATFLKQWPGEQASLLVTSPKLSFDEYMDGAIPKEEAINVMVGDMQRIREYPKRGWQAEQEIPGRVWEAFSELVELGFTSHLLTFGTS